MASRPKHWVKLWVSWLTTPAHIELSEGAIGLGPLLMLLATWDGEYDGGGWLLTESGRPLGLDSLARTTRRSRESIESQVAELIECRTLTRREDGALGFQKFGHWQETRNASYMRGVRADNQAASKTDSQDRSSSESARRDKQAQRSLKSLDTDVEHGGVTVTPTITSRIGGGPPNTLSRECALDAEVTGITKTVKNAHSDKVVCDRRQTTDGRANNPPTPQPGGGTSAPRNRQRQASTDERVLAVFARIDEWRAKVGLEPMSESARTTKTIAARMKSGATLEELLSVVDAFGALAEADPEKRTILCATTPFTGATGERTGGWAWGLKLVDESRARPMVGRSAVNRVGPAMPDWRDVVSARERE